MTDVIKRNPRQLLLDSRTVRLTLVEGKTNNGRMVVEGEFASYVNPTENKRFYPEKLWTKQMQRLESSLKNHRVYGELDHPCVNSSDFRVFCAEGWKPFSAVAVGDQVWSRKDGEAVLSTVTGIIDQPYSGATYHIYGRSIRGVYIDSEFTPAHKVILFRNPEAGDFTEISIPIETLASNRGDYATAAIPACVVEKYPDLVKLECAYIPITPEDVQIEKREHTGNIYCLTATHGNFYMEQNDHAFWTGNSDGKTMLQRCSHIVTGLHLKDGKVIGEAVILNTRLGLDLQEIIKAGGGVGVSSRGFGSTVTTDKGLDEVQDDYQLMTFDFVADPADSNAYPSVKFEGREIFDDVPELVEVLPKTEAEIRAEERASVLAEFTAKAKTAPKASVAPTVIPDASADLLAEVKKLIAPHLIEEASKAQIRQLQEELSVRDEQIANLTAQFSELEAELDRTERVALVAGYRFHVEQQLLGDPDAKLLRSLIGDVENYENVNALQEKIDEIRSSLEAKRTKDREQKEAVERQFDGIRKKYEAELDQLRSAQAEERERIRQEAAEAEERAALLAEKLEESLLAHKEVLEENRSLQLKVYAEDQIAHNPRAPQVRQILESAHPRSRKDIDQIVETTRIRPPRDEEEQGELRVKVRRNLGSSARVPAPADEEIRKPLYEESKRRRDYNGTGSDLDHLRTLAGIGETRD